jgi:GTP-binding protein EngB required for normal cell division
MAGLNENHRRRLLAAFKYMDDLLGQSLNAIAPDKPGLYPKCFQDISPSELHWIESYVDKLREQFLSLIKRFDVEIPAPSTPSSWILKTNLKFLEIAIEELYPEHLRGYGEMDPKSASDFTWTLQEVQRLLGQLFAFLTEEKRSQETSGIRYSAEPAVAAMLEQLSQIIERHRLVEFLPVVNSITRKLETHRYEIAVFGRVSSGKSSFINRLLDIQLLPVGATPITSVPIHILGGEKALLKVIFPDRIMTLDVEALPEFATEQGNPANSKRVVGLEVTVPLKRLQEGIAFVDTPGIASLATNGTKLAYAYMPDSDFGIVLIDSQSTIGRDDLDMLRALHLAGIPSVVLISKCDLLSPENVEKVRSYTRSAIIEHLGYSLDVVPISSADSWIPEMERWFQSTIVPLLKRGQESLVISMNRKIQSLRNSLLATLEIQSTRRTDAMEHSQNSEQILRPADESIEVFDQRWSKKLENISDCKEEILEDAAAQMAQTAESGNSSEREPAKILVDALLRSLTSRCNPFLLEYQSPSERIAAQLEAFRQGNPESELLQYEPPKPSGLPAPTLSLLDGISIAGPGAFMRISRAARERHFKKELIEKAGDPIDKVLKELSPRLYHWYRTTIRALKDSYHIQTDPFRYRGQETKSVVSADLLRNDIENLKTGFRQLTISSNAPMIYEGNPGDKSLPSPV